MVCTTSPTGDRSSTGSPATPWSASSSKGRLSRLDVCDAHPELLRAARNVGRPTGETCPICEEADLVDVTFVFGSRLPPGGRCVASQAELTRYWRRKDPVVCYVSRCAPSARGTTWPGCTRPGPGWTACPASRPSRTGTGRPQPPRLSLPDRASTLSRPATRPGSAVRRSLRTGRMHSPGRHQFPGVTDHAAGSLQRRWTVDQEECPCPRPASARRSPSRPSAPRKRRDGHDRS